MFGNLKKNKQKLITNISSSRLKSLSPQQRLTERMGKKIMLICVASFFCPKIDTNLDL